jgi:hypothetical protein
MIIFDKLYYVIAITINETEADRDTEAKKGSRNLVRASVSLGSLLMSGFEY